MKISILVPGRLHAFDMAIYFQKMGVLNELVTGYPTRYVLPFGIHKKHVKSIYINEVINRTTNFLGIGYPLAFIACEAYDFIASKTIKFDSDYYFIFSSYALKTIKRIKKKNKNAIVILIRSSAHILAQEKLMRIFNNSDKQQINKRIVEKEIKEYEVADYITVPSTFALQTFIERGFEQKKMFLNFFGVQLSQFPFVEKSLHNGPIKIGNVGTISSRKNIVGLIDVIAALNKELPRKFELVLVGPIDHESFDEKLLKMHDFIDYRGKLPQSELYKIYAEMDVFAINSIEDGFAMVILQAMSCGCPIIATTNTAGIDVVKNYENGIIIPILDNDALSNSLEWFYHNRKEIPEMGRKSRAITENGFVWDDYGDRNMQFLHKLEKNFS